MIGARRFDALPALLVGALGAAASCGRQPFSCLTPPRDGVVLDHLNEPLRLDFSAPIDPASVASGAIRLVHDGDGTPVRGRFRCEGATLTFVPEAPAAPDLSDAAFLPGARVKLEVTGLPRLTALRSLSGEGLATGFTERRPALPRARDWITAPCAELFVDPVPGPPELLSRTARLVGGRITLRFSEPLDPRTVAAARFRLHGPWSRESHPAENPDLAATLAENGTAAELHLSLRSAEALPMQVDAATPLELRFEPRDALRDLAGAALQQNGGPFYPYVPVVVGRE
jgi:hypothetical protein